MNLDYNVTYRKKDKGIQCIISYKDNNGKWKQKSKQGFKTQKDTKEFIKKTVTKLEQELNQGITLTNKELTFKEVFEAFINHSSLYKEYNTLASYHRAMRYCESIYSKEMIKVNRSDVIECVDKMKKNNLKKASITLYLGIIKNVFNYYIDNMNPTFTINLNKVYVDKVKEPTIKKALTQKELSNLLNDPYLKNDKYYAVIYIIANTGMRLSEVCGLTWDNINEAKMTIKVDKQWKKLKEGGYGFGVLKSKNSYRDIPISTTLIKFLRNYKKTHPTDLFNRVICDNDLNIKTRLNPMLKKVADITLHELRHTYITLLIANGLDFKTVAQIAGHDVEQTLKTYSHVNTDSMNKACNIISEIF